MPGTSVHYLRDGILTIEYDMLENRSLVISDIQYSPDYSLTSVNGDTINYKLWDADLPKG